MINYRIPFIVGAGIGVVSLVAAQFMRSSHKADEDVLPVYTVRETEEV